MDMSKIYLHSRKLAIEAGQKIMEIYAEDDVGVDIKADNSPVTRADTAADTHIFNGLQDQFSDSVIITEEQAQTHLLKAQDFFIVDPLDGTKGFIHGGKNFTVNIAYVVERTPVFGVIYAPARGRLFYTTPSGEAVEEFGTHNPDSIGDCSILHVREPNNEALCFVASHAHKNSETERYIQAYATEQSETAGSSLKFCLVAAGQADIYPRLAPTMEWDTAAGHAILLAAGGHVVDFDTHEPLLYGKEGFLNPSFIAYSAGVRLISSAGYAGESGN